MLMATEHLGSALPEIERLEDHMNIWLEDGILATRYVGKSAQRTS